MLPYRRLTRLGVMLALIGGVFHGTGAQAQVQHISVNLGALNGLGTYYIDYTLTDGSGTADGNSTASISSFQIVGGALGSVLPPTTGDVTGVLGNGGTLTFTDDGASRNGSSMNTSGTADFAQAFTISSPSSVLRFNLNLAAVGLDITPGPDNFALQILDSTFMPLATTGPTGAELLNVIYSTPHPVAIGYASTDPLYKPAITASVTPAPEPSAFVTLGLGIAAMLLLGQRARVKQHAMLD